MGGNPENDWGGNLLIYHWIVDDPNSQISARGEAIIDGVEFYSMGQRNSDKAGIRMLYTNTPGDTTIVKNSAIHDCPGKCIYADYAHHVLF